MRRLLLSAIVLAASAALGYFYLAPLPLRTYRLITSDGKSFKGAGTEIRAVGGFCSELVMDGRVTAVVCQPHMVVEVREEDDAGKVILADKK